MDGFNYWLLCIQQYPPVFLAGGPFQIFIGLFLTDWICPWLVSNSTHVLFSPLNFLNAFIWKTVFKGWKKRNKWKLKPQQQQRRKEQLYLSTVFISPPLREVHPYSALSSKHETDPHQLYKSQLKEPFSIMNAFTLNSIFCLCSFTEVTLTAGCEHFTVWDFYLYTWSEYF